MSSRAPRFMSLAIVVGSLCFAWGCGSSDDSSTSTDAAPSTQAASTQPTTTQAASGGEKALVGFANPIATVPSQQGLIHGAREAGGHDGLDLQVADANLSADKQVSDVDAFVTRDAKGILTWTLNQGAADAAYQRAQTAGIPVIGFNSTSDFIASVIKTDTDSTCRPMDDAAKYIATRRPNAKVFVMGGPPVESITLAVDCFEKAAKREGLDVVDKKDNTENTIGSAQRIMADALTQHPDLEAAWVFNDVGGLGISAALGAADKTVWSGDEEGFILIGKDGDAPAVEAIKAGQYTATYDSNFPLAGGVAAALIGRHIKDGTPLPPTVRVPYTRIEASNAAEYVDPTRRPVTVDGDCVSTKGVEVCLD